MIVCRQINISLGLFCNHDDFPQNAFLARELVAKSKLNSIYRLSRVD